MDTLFRGLFDTDMTQVIPIMDFMLCIGFALLSGLIAGMGYLGYTLLFTFVIGGINMIYSHIDFGAKKQSEKYKILNITIPENLDYTGVFDDILSKYTKVYELTHVRSTNMGSMFKLTYNITLKKVQYEKNFIDELRCRNGNLEISVSKQDTLITEL